MHVDPNMVHCIVLVASCTRPIICYTHAEVSMAVNMGLELWDIAGDRAVLLYLFVA